MARRDIVVLGASAGGVEILTQVLADAAEADATFVVVVHMAANARTALPAILRRATGLECTLAADGDALEPGRVLIAPPDRHLVVERGRISLVNGPRENRARPAIDPLFRTAALAYGPRVIAVALSGVLDDGTAGAAAVRRRGGVIVVQDPDDALFADIPRSIIEHVGADHVLPGGEIGALVARLSTEEVEDYMPIGEDEDPVVAGQDELLRKAEAGDITHFTCPECSGTLWEVDEDGVLRYRCRVGHVYSLEALREAQGESVETALWIAMRALEEQAGLIRRAAERSRGHHTPRIAARHELRADEVAGQARVIRDLLDQLSGLREQAASAGE
jgi:two-component system chemotaxis response regulator CheB